MSLSSVIYQQKVGVVVVQTGEPSLSLLIDLITSWETTLQVHRS